MSFVQEASYTLPDSTAFDRPRQKTPLYAPLQKMGSDSFSETNIASRLQNMMLVDDDDIFDEDDVKDFTYLPAPATFMALSDSSSSDSSHTQYVNTFRKNRPLPKIPDKSISKNLTESQNDNYKSQNKLTAQQLFEMLSHSRISTMDTEYDDEEEEYGGVFALKTQIPSPHISNSVLPSYQYENFNTNYYKMMTPVEEVEEEQFYASKNEEDSSPTYLLEPVDQTTTGRHSFDASKNTPSLASGRTSPSSNNSRISMDSGNQSSHRPDAKYATYYHQDLINVKQLQETEKIEIQRIYQENFCSHQPANSDVISSNVVNYNLTQNPPRISEFDREHIPNNKMEEISLVSDVKRLAELNKALMTPIIPYKHIETTQTKTNEPEFVEPTPFNDYKNIDTNSPLAMTSFSLTHDKESIKTYRRMATKTNDKNIQFTYAKYLLQLVSFYGVDNKNNTTRDRLQEEAEYWIEKLAKSNHTEALYIKGQWHGHCCDKSAIGVFVGSQYKKINSAKAFKCFQQAAKLGFTEAHYELAEYWKYRRDYKKALSNYRYAASKNHILSLYKLANIMLRGLLNQEKDVRQGLIFLQKAADADKPESARSAYDLACLYSNDLESIGLDRNTLIVPGVSSQTHNLAVHYYKKADRLGLTLATFRLGYIYEHGHLNTEANVSEAFKYYLKAAERKHVVAMLEISRLYKDGIPGFINPNPITAHEWCTRATESGNEIAEFMLGIYFEFGVGVRPDQKQAYMWYTKAASKGYGPAENKLNIPQSKRKNAMKTQEAASKNKNEKHGSKGKKYYEDSVRIAEKSRRTRAEQENCQIM